MFKNRGEIRTLKNTDLTSPDLKARGIAVQKLEERCLEGETRALDALVDVAGKGNKPVNFAALTSLLRLMGFEAPNGKEITSIPEGRKMIVEALKTTALTGSDIESRIIDTRGLEKIARSPTGTIESVRALEYLCSEGDEKVGKVASDALEKLRKSYSPSFWSRFIPFLK